MADTLSFSEQMNYLHYLISENHAIEDSEKAQLILSKIKDSTLDILNKKHVNRNDFRVENKVFSILVSVVENQESKCDGEKKYDNMTLVPLILTYLNKIIALEYSKDLEKFLVDFVDNQKLEKRVALQQYNTNYDTSVKNQAKTFRDDFYKKLEKICSKQKLTGFRKEIDKQKIKLDENLREYVAASIKGLFKKVLEKSFSNSSIDPRCQGPIENSEKNTTGDLKFLHWIRNGVGGPK